MHLIGSFVTPDMALLLMALGALGVFAEFSSPGMILPGAGGSALVLLGIAVLSSERIDPRGMALALAAFALFGLEARLGSRGLLTVAGAAALWTGAAMLVDSQEPAHRIHAAAAGAITLPFSILTSLLLSIAVKARRNKSSVAATAESRYAESCEGSSEREPGE